MAGKLQGRIALVTAAASGMGAASARLFADEGATVIVADLDGAAAEITAEQIRKAGGKAVAYAIDVSDVSALQVMFDFVDREFGLLHVLFNHAGVPGPTGLDISEEQFDRIIDINIKSQFFCSKLALPLLQRAAPNAAILFTASISGVQAAPSSPLYGLTKGGTVILMRSLAKQLGPQGIRSNAICPGPIETPMLRVFTDPNRAGLSEEEFAKQLEQRRNAIPLRRAGQPEDIARAALFLACDDSAFVTGVTLPVDGGMLA